MKSTKRILSAILSVVMILGCLTVGFTAQASAADLVDAIAKGGDVNWTGGNVTLTETLVINGDVTVDFNGAVITGPVDKTAINIKSGNVTLYDGVIIADNRDWSGETGFVKALMNYKPAISINGGDVKLNCITAVGSVLRVPNSSSVEVPIGNGINANAGKVELDNVIAIGMKALDNTKADVVVKDAILAGIYKAVNQYTDVDFGADYTQYQTVDFLEGFLKDGVSLSANEKKYIASATNSQGDFSIGSVVVNVEKPNFNEPTTTYVEGVLNVFAVVENHEEDGVSNRYSYTYTPDYCEIDGEKVEFELVEGQYVASFEGLEENADYDALVNYDLSVKLGKKQKEIVENAMDILAHYVDKAPELLYRFVKDFEDLYQKAESLVAYAFNLLTAEETKDMFDGLEEIVGLIYALEGQEFNGIMTDEDNNEVILNNALYEGHYASLKSDYDKYGYSTALENAVKFKINSEKTSFASHYGAIYDTDGDEIADSVFAYFNENTFAATATFDESDFAKGTPGYGSGKGLLDVFDEYYDAIMAKLYNGSTTEFNDIGAAAEYIGDNWEGILELAENAVVVLDKAYAIVNGESNSDAVNALLEKVLGSGNFSSYISAFNTAVKYVHKIMDRVDEAKESSFVATYGDKAGEYCKRYALKAWNIVNNTDTYFDIEVEGDYVNVDLTKDELNAEFKVNTNVEVKDVYVQVKISGYGSAEVNGVAVSANSDEIWFEYGETINVVPVAKDAGCSFAYMTVDNGSNSVVVDGDSFTTKAATNLIITVVFQQKGDSDETDFVFMTDKALNYKLLDGFTLSDDQVAAEWDFYTLTIEAPDFAKLTKLGWSLDKDGTNPVALADLAEAAAEAAVDEAVVIVYAIYEYDEYTNVGEHGETVKFNKAPYVEGERIYFELSVQIRGDKKAIEAGIILLAEQKDESFDYEAEMKVDKAGTAGYVFSRTTLKDADGYVNSDVLHTVGVKSSKTVYARGYVVWEDGTVTYTTDIVSGTVA